MFALLNHSIIRPSREIGPNSFLKNPILIRLVRLERGLRGLWQDEIPNPGDSKLHRYKRFNIELLEGKKKHAFKDHCSKDHTSIVKGKSPTTRYVWLVFTFEIWVSSLAYVCARQHKYIHGFSYISMSLYVTVSFDTTFHMSYSWYCTFDAIYSWYYIKSAKSIWCCKFMLLVLS